MAPLQRRNRKSLLLSMSNLKIKLLYSGCAACIVLLLVIYVTYMVLSGFRISDVLQTSKTDASGQSMVNIRISLTSSDKNIVYKDFNYLAPSTLTYNQAKYGENSEVYFRFPILKPTSALLVIFHGCGRYARDWFQTVERQRIVGAAIDLGFGCLAFQSTDRESRCWSTELDIYANPDVQMVIKGLDEFFQQYPTLKNITIFTFGASSGGIFSSIFALNGRYKVRGQILFISFIHPGVLRTFVKKNQYPPTAWIYMPRDIEFASEERINKSVVVFQEETIPYAMFDIQPISLSSSTFHERIPTISFATSHYLHFRFQMSKWLDNNNRFIYNPRRRDPFIEVINEASSNTTMTTKISKEIKQHETVLIDFFNTIYGEHEISFERSYEAFKWHLRIQDEIKRLEDSNRKDTTTIEQN